MPRTTLTVLSALAACLLFSACAKVYTQPVPVSSNPSGALATAGGRASCTTPCTLELARNQDHIVTVILPGYKQADVSLTRQYRQESVTRAVGVGLGGLKDGGDPLGGLGAGMDALREQEQSGEAYVLTPSTVQVDLVPLRP